MITLHLKPGRHRRIHAGHRWAFAGEISENLKEIKPGEAVALCESRGKLLGKGYVNPRSLIAVRLMTTGSEPWDDSFLRHRISRAVEHRSKVLPDAEACRLVYSESDGIPGLVVDKYGDHLVLQSHTAGIEIRLGEIVDTLRELLDPKSIYFKGNSSFRNYENLPLEDAQLIGKTPDAVEFNENSAVYSARIIDGQKTGFFLDQRVNRWVLGDILRDRKILDLYSYTGSWGIASLLNGAAHCTFIDSSQSALEWGKSDAAKNKVDDRCNFISEDVSRFLSGAMRAGELWDVVFLDPPSLIPARSSMTKGKQHYRWINQQALAVVAPGGLFVSSSCSHHLSREEHLAIIGEAASKSGRRLRVIHAGSQAPDHPILPGHPETEYLSTWFLSCE